MTGVQTCALPISQERSAAFAVIREVLSASAKISGETAKRLHHVAELFGVDATETPDRASNVAPLDPKAKAS